LADKLLVIVQGLPFVINFFPFWSRRQTEGCRRFGTKHPGERRRASSMTFVNDQHQRLSSVRHRWKGLGGSIQDANENAPTVEAVL
jgi:hypothetical protein